MDEQNSISEGFEKHRPRLRAVAYRMLGSLSEADDALQEAWLRIRHQDAQKIENMQAWLTTVVGRICLNLLRARRARPEPLSDVFVPDPVVRFAETSGPEQEALLADSVGLALLVVLESMSPAERLAFVLHDVFGIPFADIARVLERSEAAAMKLASRARQRVQGSPQPDADPARQRPVVNAFFAAARDGDFDALVAMLDPDVTLRIDGGQLRGAASVVIRGAEQVASHTRTYAKLFPYIVPALVNGGAGAVIAPHGEPYAVMAFVITDGRIRTIDALQDPDRLRELHLALPHHHGSSAPRTR